MIAAQTHAAAIPDLTNNFKNVHIAKSLDFILMVNLARNSYISLIPHLKAFTHNQSIGTKMKYRGTEHVHEPDKSSDIFDGLNYQDLCREHVEVNGRRFEHKYFDDESDIALGFIN
jgi:hypothetical protein